MSKRAAYEKRPRNYYPTPLSAVEPLEWFGHGRPFTFCEPCAGDGRLVRHLDDVCGGMCLLAMDTEPQVDWVLKADAMGLTEEGLENCQYIITNPPFTWSILKPMMDLWISLRPTLLLLPADFMHNKRVAPYIKKCNWIQSVGRVRWMEDTTMSSVENFAWYMFDKHWDGDTYFYGRV